VRKPRTEQDDVTDNDELERDAVTVKTEDEEGGAEEETYGPGAGDKVYVEYTKNAGFWEPGALLYLQMLAAHEGSSTRKLALEPGCISQLAPNLAHDGRTKFTDADFSKCRYASQSWFFASIRIRASAQTLPDPVSPGSAACVDSERNLVWACGDARIKAFSFTSPELPCKYTLQVNLTCTHRFLGFMALR
jgi:hypothetical protein